MPIQPSFSLFSIKLAFVLTFFRNFARSYKIVE